MSKTELLILQCRGAFKSDMPFTLVYDTFSHDKVFSFQILPLFFAVKCLYPFFAVKYLVREFLVNFTRRRYKTVYSVYFRHETFPYVK